MSKKEIPTVKIAIMGGGAVGKSCCTVQYVKHEFDMDQIYDPTIEDTYTKYTKVDNSNVIVDIIDTAGQEEFKSLQDTWMRKSEGFLLVYDVTSKNSFHQTTSFVEKVKQVKETETFPLVLAANKIDIPKSEWSVSTEEGKNLAKSFNCPFFEVSAKQRKNIDEAFNEVIRLILKERTKKNKMPKQKGLFVSSLNEREDAENDIHEFKQK